MAGDPTVYPMRSAACAGYHVDSIDSAHHLIHKGVTFETEYHNGALADAGTIEIVITVGATYDCHVVWELSSGGDADFEIYEGRTTTGGTALQPRNANRSIAYKTNGEPTASPDTICQETVVHTPGTSSGGTLIQFGYIQGGTGPLSGGGGSAGRHEIILKRGVKYSFILTGRHGAGNKRAQMELDWYEHPPVVSQQHETVYEQRL